jgi:hypothetical protein
MAKQQKPIPVVDPDNIPETVCIGRFNVTHEGGIGTITFTHERKRPNTMMGDIIDLSDKDFVVRARIVTTVGNLAALRDVLNSVLKEDTAAPTAVAERR